MRRNLLILLVFLAGVGVAGAEDWHKSYTVTGKPDVKLDVNDGSIRVSSADAAQVIVNVDTGSYHLGTGGVRITERQDGNRVEVEIRGPRGHFCFVCIQRSLRVEVIVPREANLNLHSGDGGLDIDNVKGEHHLATGDGHMELHSIDGSLIADTSDGHIRLDGRFDALDLHTGDGGIDASIRPGSKMTTSWLVRTGDGHIELRLPENFSADLDAHTGDGHVTSDLPITISGSLRGSTIRGKLNGGGPTLEIRSGDGSIRLLRY